MDEGLPTSLTDGVRTALKQLQQSLVYLGAKYVGLLVCAEPVTDAEKEHRHWLTSPLFARGLPLQLPADHGLMHPFFGIKPLRDEVRRTAAMSEKMPLLLPAAAPRRRRRSFFSYFSWAFVRFCTKSS